jgi:glutathione S-transferase
MPGMRLHYHPLSAYSRKTAIGVRLREDPIDLVEVAVFAGALRDPAFLGLSPFGKIPVLETDAGPIIESTSILEYLEARGPRRLLPAGQEWRARHLDRVADNYLLSPIGDYFWDKSEEQREESTRTLSRGWAYWERELGDRRFMCGDEITLADLSAAVALHYCGGGAEAQAREDDGHGGDDAGRRGRGAVEPRGVTARGDEGGEGEARRSEDRRASVRRAFASRRDVHELPAAPRVTVTVTLGARTVVTE